MNQDLLQRMREIGKELRAAYAEQRNRCTDAPLWLVQQKERTYGFDPQYTDGEGVVWIDVYNDHNEADAEEHARIEVEYNKTGDEPDGWRRTVYRDDWVFVTACFTERGAEEYIRRNGHNLKEPRIYADGSYRNEEFRAVREFLMSLAQ